MHTIEAAFLVPLGLGIIVVLMAMSFCLHDQVAVAAESAAILLEWQHGEEVNVNKEEMGARLTDMSMITNVTCTDLTEGKMKCRIRLTENWQVFRRGIELIALSNSASEIMQDNTRTRSFSLIKIDPCWLKRIWRVSGIE